MCMLTIPFFRSQLVLNIKSKYNNDLCRIKLYKVVKPCGKYMQKHRTFPLSINIVWTKLRGTETTTEGGIC